MSSVPLYGAVSFDGLSPAERLRRIRTTLGDFAGRMTPASELPERLAPPMVSTGIRSVDALAGGLPCGALTEIFGPPSSGRTSLLFSALAVQTRQRHACALVDVSDSFDPLSAANAGIELSQLLWVRCNGAVTRREPTHVTRYVENDFGVHEAVEVRTNVAESPARASKDPHLPAAADVGRRKLAFRRLEQGLRAADLLLQSGGFSLIALDAADLTVEIVRRVPMTTWYRFRRGVENTPTAFVLLTRDTVASGCASLSLRLERTSARRKMVENRPTSANDGRCGAPGDTRRPSHAAVLEGMNVAVEMVRGPVSEHYSGVKKRVKRAEFVSAQSAGSIQL